MVTKLAGLGMFGLFGLLAACTSHIAGDLSVDGQPFKVTECRSGAAFNFPGLQLADEAGARVRLLQKVDGTVSVAVFAPGATTGATFPDGCGTLAMETQHSTINNIKNVEGKLTLDCAEGAHSAKGALTFDNCH